MCDYSLQGMLTRDARVGDKLTVSHFGKHGTRGFAAPECPDLAVCVKPGTELAFEASIATDRSYLDAPQLRSYATAIFRQVNTEKQFTHHDALELPSGQVVLLSLLALGQCAVVLQLPAQPRTKAEAAEQTRLEYNGA